MPRPLLQRRASFKMTPRDIRRRIDTRIAGKRSGKGLSQMEFIALLHSLVEIEGEALQVGADPTPFRGKEWLWRGPVKSVTGRGRTYIDRWDEAHFYRGTPSSRAYIITPKGDDVHPSRLLYHFMIEPIEEGDMLTKVIRNSNPLDVNPFHFRKRVDKFRDLDDTTWDSLTLALSDFQGEDD